MRATAVSLTRSVLIGVTLVSFLAVGGCSSMSGGPGPNKTASTVATSRTSTDLAKIQTKRIGEGVLTGAVVGGSTLLFTVVSVSVPSRLPRL